MKPNVLMLVDWFAPASKAGGIITACKNFALQTSARKKVFVLTSAFDLNNELLPQVQQNRWTLFENDCFVHYAGENKMNTRLIMETVNALQPECIYLNSLFSLRFALLVLWLKWRGKITCPVILNTHGMMMPEALKIKSLKKKVFLALLRVMRIPEKIIFQTNIQKEYDHIQRVLNPAQLKLVPQPLYVMPKAETILPEKEPGFLRLAFLGRIHPVKNLGFALDVLKQVSCDVELRIIGAVEDKLYWQQCQRQIEALPVNIHVKLYGGLPQHEAEQLLRESHALFLPSTTENFCFAAYESLTNGRPIIVSDRTPWRNLETVGAGWDIPLQEPRQFVQAIEKMVMMGQGEFARLSETAQHFASQVAQTGQFTLSAAQQPERKIA